MKKVNWNKTKHVPLESELKKPQIFDSGYFRGKNHFEEDGTQNYLVFQSMKNYFKNYSNTDLKHFQMKLLKLALHLIKFLLEY